MIEELELLKEQYLLDIVGKNADEIDVITLKYKQDCFYIEEKWILIYNEGK
jgi:hypothetical protein